MNIQPEAETEITDPAKVAEADVPDAQKKKDQYMQSRQEDAKKCTTEFQELLKKYNCFTDVALLISTDGNLKGNIIIKPRI